MNFDKKLDRVEDLDERITRAKALERKALIKGAILAVAMFTLMGAWSSHVDTPMFDLFRWGMAICLFNAEFVIRRSARRGLEARQDLLLDTYSGEPTRPTYDLG